MAKEKIEPSTVKKISSGSGMKSKKLQKPKTATHPPYFQMIKEALINMKDKNGSSPYAIAKLIKKKHKSLLPDNFRKTLSLQLKNSVINGKLVKIRASYKLSETTTKSTRQKESVTKTRSSSRKSKRSVNKPDKVATKKMTKAKKKPRQLMSIKSLGSKKALKASAT